MQYFALAVVALLAACGAEAKYERGQCPKQVTTMNPFDIEKYIGLWYENYVIPTVFETGQKCIYANYTVMEGTTDKVHVVNNAQFFGRNVKIVGEAYAVDPQEPARLTLRFTGVPRVGKYWVLDTDYKTHSLVYSCSNIGPFLKNEIGWVLTRTRDDLASDDLDKYLATFKAAGVDPSLFKKSDQTNCAN